MTEPLFRTDPYKKTARARVVARTGEGGVIVDRSVFYPRGGGQPGDSGRLVWEGGEIEIATAMKADPGQGIENGIILVPADAAPLPPVGAEVEQRLDWERRHRHMRMHSALHLLSVVVPLPVTGGAIGAERGRLDFDMPEMLYDREFITARLGQLIAADHQVSESWISEAELEANPDLVKTFAVQPPRGQGKVRMVRIHTGDLSVDYQPCGGTHVARTSEIGVIKVAKIEKKGKQNRRVVLSFADL